MNQAKSVTKGKGNPITIAIQHSINARSVAIGF